MGLQEASQHRDCDILSVTWAELNNGSGVKLPLVQGHRLGGAQRRFIDSKGGYRWL